MADHMTTLEVVELPTGRYTVQAVGSTSVDLSELDFATRVEAENWLFEQNEQLDENAAHLGIVKPGGGQAIR